LARANRRSVNRLPYNGGGPERTNAGSGVGAARNCSVCGPAKLTAPNRNAESAGGSAPARPGMI
jgi:hypothetical protein